MEVEEQQDDAADGGPEAVGAVLGVLRTIGLTGPRLALQMGDEECLSKQLAQRAGVAYAPWVLRLVKGQVKEAFESLELDVRLAGGSAPLGVQTVQDATEALLKDQETRRAAQAADPGIKVVRHTAVVPVRGAMKKIPRGAQLGQEAQPDEEEAKVLRVLQDELTLMGAPVLETIWKTADPERAKRALLGKYRPSTVRRYLAYWQGFRKWAEVVSGDVPRRSTQLIDYLHAREEEGMGPSVPLSVGKAVAWFENLAGFDQSEWVSSDPFVDMVVKDLLRKLEDGAPPRKRAPRMLSAFLPALEEVVVRKGIPDSVRAGAWAKLVKVWASLRFDDLAHLRRPTVKFYDGRMAGLMRRTKTTGAGKRVKELPFFISEEAWAVHKEWLTKGMESLGRSLADEYELLVPSGSSRSGMAEERVMAYQEAVAWSSEVMRYMTDDEGAPLLPEGWERFWTEHSERSTLASGLAAVGVAKSDRDMLGRWTPEGSDQYVRTYNAVARGLQQKYASPVREGRGYQAFDEGAVLEELKEWLVEKWGVDAGVANRAVEEWKPKVSTPGFFTELLKEGQGPEPVAKGPVVPAQEDSSSSSSSSSSEEEEGQAKKRKVDRLDEERSGGYVVVYNRIDRGKLHRGGKHGCWMAKQRKFKRAAVHEEMPDPTMYTTRCKMCWPEKRGAEASSSDSEDEVSDSEAPAPPKRDELYSAGGNISGDIW